jgi:hypothetical protein
MKKLEVKDGTEEKPVYWIVKVKAVNLGARNPVEMDEEVCFYIYLKNKFFYQSKQLDFDDAVLQEVLKKKLSLVVDTSVGDAYYVYIDPDKGILLFLSIKNLFIKEKKRKIFTSGGQNITKFSPKNAYLFKFGKKKVRFISLRRQNAKKFPLWNKN